MSSFATLPIVDIDVFLSSKSSDEQNDECVKVLYLCIRDAIMLNEFSVGGQCINHLRCTYFARLSRLRRGQLKVS